VIISLSAVAAHHAPRDPTSTRSWFGDLLREQNNFSFGFNRIKNEESVVEMQRLLDGKEA
jgi:hypothetical protein